MAKIRLILPPSHVIHGTSPSFACTLCEKVFWSHERAAFERHVLSHPVEDMVPHSPQMQAPALFGEEGGDQDWAKWVREHAESDPDGWERWGRTDDGKHSSGLGDG